MGPIEIQILESLVVFIVFLIIRYVIKRSINNHYIAKMYSPKRKVLITRIMNVVIVSVLSLFVASIWGINQEDIIIFVSSILTLLSVAFFAQWSILSNITAGLILFFNNKIRIDESIRILEKDVDISGKVIDIGLFSTQIQTENFGTVSIPNNMLIQKTVSIELTDS